MNRTLWTLWTVWCVVHFFFMAVLASWSFWAIVDWLVKALGKLPGPRCHWTGENKKILRQVQKNIDTWPQLEIY